ncbi:MAG: hypothetical protein AAF647_12805 [Pseudomonadota bacterium]
MGRARPARLSRYSLARVTPVAALISFAGVPEAFLRKIGLVLAAPDIVCCAFNPQRVIPRNGASRALPSPPSPSFSPKATARVERGAPS